MSKKKETPVQLPIKEKLSLDNDYPGLNVFKYAIGYLEQSLNIASEPLLAFCFIIAVIDFMTGGHLMDIDVISYLWASAFALAVTASFIITWRRAATALQLNRYLLAFFLAFLGALLGIVDGAAIATKGLQQMLNIPFNQALTWLALNPVAMVYIRSGVAVCILVVVALSNHLAITTASAPKRRLALWDQMLDKLAPVVSGENAQGVQEVISQPAQGKQSVGGEQVSEVEQVISQPAKLSIVKRSSESDNLERVRQALSQEPGCSDRRLGKLAGVSAITAKRYRLMLTEDAQEEILTDVSACKVAQNGHKEGAI